MSEHKGKSLMDKLKDDLDNGQAKTYTKTEKEKIEDAESLEERKRKAFLATAVLLGATFEKLEELERLNAMGTQDLKLSLKRAKNKCEQHINKIFDLKESNGNDGAYFIDEGATHIFKLLDQYVP